MVVQGGQKWNGPEAQAPGPDLLESTGQVQSMSATSNCSMTCPSV